MPCRRETAFKSAELSAEQELMPAMHQVKSSQQSDLAKRTEVPNSVSKPWILVSWRPSHGHLHSEMGNGTTHTELSGFVRMAGNCSRSHTIMAFSHVQNLLC